MSQWNPEVTLVHGRPFRRYLTEAEILEAVDRMAAQINEDLKDENPLFVVILNGAFIFAADLYRRIKIPSEITSTRLKSYDGTETTGSVKVLMPLYESPVGRTVVIVEDIVDSGYTIKQITEQLKNSGAKDVKTAILLHKPTACKVDGLELDYVAFEIPEKFIVGYGLDYDESARGLRDIYTLDE